MNSPSFPPTLSLPPDDFDAVIFDLDGVVTKTAQVHAKAWKKMFDEFLSAWSDRHGTPFQPFDIDHDYRTYVDGKPRVDGVRSFLESRGITLSEGRGDDPPERETINGLGNRKNRAFLATLKEKGVEVYASTVELLHRLRERGFKTAIISSSKNCVPVLEKAGILKLFDAKVDGLDSSRLGIPGKPAPDIFLEAARQLGVDPSRTVVVEDAISGVQAGRAGGFRLVLGVDRTDDPLSLLSHGACVTVPDLAAVWVPPREEITSALENFHSIIDHIGSSRLAVFLDYDGTLTPIVETPDKAVLSESTRETVTLLSRVCPVGIISGRDVADVKKLVGIDTLIYAGSHGFDISGPEGFSVEHGIGDEFLPVLDEAETQLKKLLSAIPKVLVERKKFAIAVHFRLVAPEKFAEIEEAVNQVHEQLPRLRKATGKMIFELQPAIDWHKGRALLSLLESLNLAGSGAIPLYIGDDVTDEDAFRVLRGKGIGIVVWDTPRSTAASFYLDDPEQVRIILERLYEFLVRRESHG